jgi:hypothetical protein
MKTGRYFSVISFVSLQPHDAKQRPAAAAVALKEPKTKKPVTQLKLI